MVFNNARALLIIQIANQLLPLVLVPYLARTLGIHLYGVVSFGLAMLAIGTVVTDYGFNLSATLNISQRRDDSEYVDRLIGAVFLIKGFLFIAVVIAIFLFVVFTRKYADYSTFLLLLALPLAAQTFQPVWYFQGIERMRNIAMFTMISRIAYTAFAFTFVSLPEHYYRLALINGAAQGLALLVALALMIKCGNRPAWPGVSFSKKIMRESTHFFWSRAAVSTYTSGAVMFLGVVGTSGQVAYYSAAEQLYKGGQSLFAPLAQALYPNMARTFNFLFLFRVVKWVTVCCVIGIFFGAIAGHWVLHLLFGSGFVQSYPVLMIFLITLAVNSPSVLLGYPFLGALGAAKSANLSVLIGGALQIGLLGAAALLGAKTAIAVSVVVLIVEASVLLLRIVWGRRFYCVWLSQRQMAQQ